MTCGTKRNPFLEGVGSENLCNEARPIVYREGIKGSKLQSPLSNIVKSKFLIATISLSLILQITSITTAIFLPELMLLPLIVSIGTAALLFGPIKNCQVKIVAAMFLAGSFAISLSMLGIASTAIQSGLRWPLINTYDLFPLIIASIVTSVFFSIYRFSVDHHFKKSLVVGAIVSIATFLSGGLIANILPQILGNLFFLMSSRINYFNLAIALSICAIGNFLGIVGANQSCLPNKIDEFFSFLAKFNKLPEKMGSCELVPATFLGEFVIENPKTDRSSIEETKRLWYSARIRSEKNSVEKFKSKSKGSDKKGSVENIMFLCENKKKESSDCCDGTSGTLSAAAEVIVNSDRHNVGRSCFHFL